MKRYNIIIALLTSVVILLVLAVNLFLDIRLINNNKLNDIELGALLQGVSLMKTIFLILILAIVAMIINVTVDYYKNSSRHTDMEELANIIQKKVDELDAQEKHNNHSTANDLENLKNSLRKDIFGPAEEGIKPNLGIKPKREEYKIDGEGQNRFDRAYKEWRERVARRIED
jgi:nitrogen fixation/metabolism regulation signal transduction histidine kinase